VFAELALGENLRRGGDARAVAHLDARRDEIAAAGIDARVFRCLVKEILKFDLAALEARGVHVGEVVRDRVQVELLGIHAGGGRVEREVHGSVI